MSYNKIMAYKVEYNWLRFLNSPYSLEEWWSLVLKEFSFFEVATQSSTDKYAIRHWEYVSPTMLKNRRIRILFDILANSETERRALLKKVQRAFTPDNNPNPFNENLWKELSFLDADCEEWKCKCQVLQGIQLSDFANQKWAGISVELITDSPYFYSSKEYSLTTKNTQMWRKLSTKLPFKWKYYKWLINYDWAIDSPLNVELNILNSNISLYPYDAIKVICQSEDGIWAFYIDDIDSLWLTNWNKIVIDSDNRRCYLLTNDWKEDITGLVRVWSSRPSLVLWANIVAIDTGVWDECIEAALKWKDLF